MGGRGGDIPRQVSIPDLFCRFFEPSSGSPRFSPPPSRGGGDPVSPPPPPRTGFTMLVLNLAKNRSSNITLLWMGVLRYTVVVHMLGSEQRFLSPQQFSLCDTSM